MNNTLQTADADLDQADAIIRIREMAAIAGTCEMSIRRCEQHDPTFPVRFPILPNSGKYGAKGQWRSRFMVWLRSREEARG